jgi:hypothetical protein
MLTVQNSLPPDLLEVPAAGLAGRLAGPTLFHLAGEREPPLFISVLLHGNETTGWDAVRRLLGEHEAALPRSVSLLVGNVASASVGLRHLDGQPDYNRIWRGGDLPEHAMAARVLEEMAARDVFAAVDVHNTSGRNPHYSCVSGLAPEALALAAGFGRRVIHARLPDTVLTNAFARLCPSVTIECGRPDEPPAKAHALRYLSWCLQADAPVSAPDPGSLDLLRTAAVVRVRPEVDFGFDEGDIALLPDIDRLNFCELEPGAQIGRVTRGTGPGLIAIDPDGRDVTGRYFRVEGERILTASPLMPAMLTLDRRIVRQDCLGYLLERVPAPVD